MRSISRETDYTQLILIAFLVGSYFVVAGRIKEFHYPFIVMFMFAILNYLMTVFIFYGGALLFKSTRSIKSFLFTYAYALMPTLVWFIANSILFVILPPPRTISILGKAFSIFFLSFSISLLLWKIILFYLAARFSMRLQFFKILYFIILYLCIMLPYSFFMYHFGIFRIPFL